MIEIRIKDEYIKLGQLLKLAGLAGSGLEAKTDILNGDVLLNGNIELQRGKKIYPGDTVEFNGEKIIVKGN
ncbi:MAG: RNA-binding S4 domain-containing protein [Lachnospiraceae bacterium]|nr:RNA-binding S4 domain-containing protein [Lachnospiraceae bacterium]